MPALILDENEAQEVIERRKASPAYCWDEVWDGTYVVMPMPDIRHDEISGLCNVALHSALEPSKHRCNGHVNVSDRQKDWLTNVRCPDAVVFLTGNPARDCFTHWNGGPDFLVEVEMPGDRCRDKFGFYSHLGTREALVIGRDPWQVESYHRRRNQLRLKGIVRPGDSEAIASSVVPLQFQLIRSRPRPKFRIVHTQTGQEWVR